MNHVYSLCDQLGLNVKLSESPHIPWEEFEKLPDDICNFVNCRLTLKTTGAAGPYPWDVERLLEMYYVTR